MSAPTAEATPTTQAVPSARALPSTQAIPSSRARQPAAGAPKAIGLRLLLLLGALTALPSLSIDTYLPALPALTRQLGTSQTIAQLTMTACLVGFAAGLLVAGPVSDAHGRRRPLLVGLGLYVLVTIGCALAPSIWALIALRFLQGATGAIGVVTGNAIVRDRASGVAAAKMFAMLMLANGAAPILGPVLGGQLLLITGWRGVFGCLGLIGVLVLVASLRGLPETLPVARRHAGGLRAAVDGFGELLRDRKLVGYTVGRAFAAAGLMAYLTASPFVFQGIYGLSPQAYSAIFATNSAGLILMGQVGGRLVGRVGPSALLRAGVVMSAGGSALLVGAFVAGAGLPVVLVGVFTTVAGMGLIFPNSTALALSRHPERAGSATALMGVSQFGLQAVIAPLTGLGGGRTAMPMAIVVVACEFVALAAILLLTNDRRRRLLPLWQTA